MTPAERMVGRRLPPEASRLDQLLTRHVSSDGTFCGRLPPDESWMKAAMLKARRTGLLRHGGLSIRFEGDRKASGVWYLTEKGETEALLAKTRVDAATAARMAWSKDHQLALNASRRASASSE